MQIKNQVITKFRSIIALLVLLFLIFFIFPLFVYSQLGPGKRLNSVEEQVEKLQENQDPIEKANIKYTASNFRDPFCPQIFISQKKEEKPKIKKIKIKVEPKISEMFSFSIQGVIWNPDNPMAIINNQVFKKGDVLIVSAGKDVTEQVTIVDIDKGGVTIGYLDQEEKFSSPAGSELHRGIETK